MIRRKKSSLVKCYLPDAGSCHIQGPDSKVHRHSRWSKGYVLLDVPSSSLSHFGTPPNSKIKIIQLWNFNQLAYKTNSTFNIIWNAQDLKNLQSHALPLYESV